MLDKKAHNLSKLHFLILYCNLMILNADGPQFWMESPQIFVQCETRLQITLIFVVIYGGFRILAEGPEYWTTKLTITCPN